MSKIGYSPEGTVESIVRDGLCTQCGFCEPVCPTHAIRLGEAPRSGEVLPVVDAMACVMCPLCLKVCPGAAVDFDRIYRDYLGVTTYSQYQGYVKEAWLSWAVDEAGRRDGASGGALTAIARFALVAGHLDFLVFARARADDPFRSETVITANPADLDGASGSLYYPVPLGEGFTRARIEQLPLTARLGLIGLPCHIHAAHNLTDTGWFRRIHWHLIFGIFCGGTWTWRATDTLLSKLGMTRRDLARFSYRGDGWPGRIHWVRKDGAQGTLARHNRGFLEGLDHSAIFSANSFFTPQRCTTCTDGLAELADLSFGDPWLKSQRGETRGKTLVVVRSDRGKHLLSDAMAQGLVGGQSLAVDLVAVTQKGMLVLKHNAGAFLWIARVLKGRAPSYRYAWSAPSPRPLLFRLYALLSRLNGFVGTRLNHRWARAPLYLIHGLLGRILKRSVRISDSDSENYFT